MAQLNRVIDDRASEVHSAEKRPPKTHITLPHHSVIFNTGANYSRTGSGNNLPLRQHSRSSRRSCFRSGHDSRLIRYENTYRMEPNSEHRLDLDRIRRLATTILETAITGYQYDAKQATKFVETLAEQIRSQMKQLLLPRYKIVTQVSVGQKNGQDVRIMSQCMWDSKWDHHVTITKETSSFYITMTIFFVYTE